MSDHQYYTNLFKVIVAGGRDFNDYCLLKEKLNIILSNRPKHEIQIVCGGARGADSLGERYAQEHGLHIAYFDAEWEEYGKKAGIMRNIAMGDYADALVAFWDVKSKGTSHMIEYAKKKGLLIRVIRY